MKWQYLEELSLSQEWKYTDYVDSIVYRITHNVTNPYSYRLNAMIALINEDSLSSSIEIFKPQKISPYVESEIIQFSEPPKLWKHRLAIKQLVNPRDTLVNWEVRIEMPSYSLDDLTPINLLATATKNVTTVSVTNTVTKILSANPARKGVKLFTADKNKTIYLDTDNVVSATSAIESLTPSKPICVPAILWVGDWYAVSPSGTVTIEVEEYI